MGKCLQPMGWTVPTQSPAFDVQPNVCQISYMQNNIFPYCYQVCIMIGEHFYFCFLFFANSYASRFFFLYLNGAIIGFTPFGATMIRTVLGT